MKGISKKITVAAVTTIMATQSAPVMAIAETVADTTPADNTTPVVDTEQESTKSVAEQCVEINQKVDDHISNGDGSADISSTRDQASAVVDSAQGVHDEKKQANDDAQAAVDSAQGELDSAAADHDEAVKNSDGALQDEKDRAAQDVADKENAVTEATQTHQSALEASNQAQNEMVAARDKENQTYRDLIDAEHECADATEENINAANQTLESASANKDEKEANVGSSQESLDDANTLYNTLFEQYTAAAESMTSAKSHLDDVNTQLTVAIDAMRSASDRFEQAEANTDPVVVKRLTDAITAAKAELDNAEQNKNDAASDLEKAKAALDAANENLHSTLVDATEAQQLVDKLQAEYDSLKSTYDTACAQRDELHDAWEQAHQSLDAAKADLEGSQSNLASKESEIADVLSQRDVAKKEVETLRSRLESMSGTGVEHTRTSLDFFNWMHGQGMKGGLEAANLLNTSHTFTDKQGNVVDLKDYTTVGAKGDATSWDNFKRALNEIKVGNLRRNGMIDPRTGKVCGDLLVSPELMAIAELRVNWSDTGRAHASGSFNVGENLAWGYGESDPTGTKYGPFVGWIDEEKVVYDNWVAAGKPESGPASQTGHYLNCVNSNYGVTGYAVSTDPNAPYYNADSQVFYFSGNEYSSYTLDQFLAIVDQYENYDFSGDENSEVATLRQQLADAEHRLAGLDANVATLQSERDGLRDIVSQHSDRVAALTDANTEAKNNFDAKVDELTQLGNDLGTSANNLAEAKDVKETADNNHLAAQMELSNRQERFDNTQDAFNDYENEYNQAASRHSVAQKNLEDYSSEYAAAKTELDNTTAEVNRLTGIRNEAQNDYTAKSNAANALSENCEQARFNLSQANANYENALDEYAAAETAYIEAKANLDKLNEMKSKKDEAVRLHEQAYAELKDAVNKAEVASGKLFDAACKLDAAKEKLTEANAWNEVISNVNRDDVYENGTDIERISYLNDRYGKLKLAEQALAEKQDAFDQAKATHDVTDGEYQKALADLTLAKVTLNRAQNAYDKAVEKENASSDNTGDNTGDNSGTDTGDKTDNKTDDTDKKDNVSDTKTDDTKSDDMKTADFKKDTDKSSTEGVVYGGDKDASGSVPKLGDEVVNISAVAGGAAMATVLVVLFGKKKYAGKHFDK